MKKLNDTVRDQVPLSVHVEDGNKKFINGVPMDGYVAELKIRAIGHFKNYDEARGHLLKEMALAINNLFIPNT